jgi:ferritin-like metal-binding protein YciE
MANHGENILEWLRDAHAMEQQAERALRAQSERIVHYRRSKHASSNSCMQRSGSSDS